MNRTTLFAMRPLARAVPAQARSMAAAPAGEKKVPPYKYMRGVVEQHTSPFEVRHIDPLMANMGHKLQHKLMDNLPDVAPALIVLGVVMWYTDYVNAKKEAEARY